MPHLTHGVRVCLLVMIGVRADEHQGTGGCWRSVSRVHPVLGGAAAVLAPARDGRTPVVAVGDGVLGFEKAVPEVFPDTEEQRCWFHVSSNVVAALPKSVHPGAKSALAQIHKLRTATWQCSRSTRWRPTTGPRGPTGSRRSPRSP